MQTTDEIFGDIGFGTPTVRIDGVDVTISWARTTSTGCLREVSRFAGAGRTAARTADDKKAERTLVLFVGEVLSITDYFVITSASNRRLVRMVVDEIERRSARSTAARRCGSRVLRSSSGC